MSPPAHLMLRGLPQRVASLEPAWHTARTQRHIHAAECLRTPQSCQPAKASAIAEPPLPPPPHTAWPPARGAALEGELRPWQEADGGAALSMSVIGCWPSGGVASSQAKVTVLNLLSRTINQSERACFISRRGVWSNVTALCNFMLHHQNKQETSATAAIKGGARCIGPLYNVCIQLRREALAPSFSALPGFLTRCFTQSMKKHLSAASSAM